MMALACAAWAGAAKGAPTEGGPENPKHWQPGPRRAAYGSAAAIMTDGWTFEAREACIGNYMKLSNRQLEGCLRRGNARGVLLATDASAHTTPHLVLCTASDY
jgi:hypothetical protein